MENKIVSCKIGDIGYCLNYDFKTNSKKIVSFKIKRILHNQINGTEFTTWIGGRNYSGHIGESAFLTYSDAEKRMKEFE